MWWRGCADDASPSLPPRAVGQIDLHVPKVGADFYVSNLHKWCMTPKGSAFLWVAPARQEMVRPLAFSHGCVAALRGLGTSPSR